MDVIGVGAVDEPHGVHLVRRPGSPGSDLADEMDVVGLGAPGKARGVHLVATPATPRARRADLTSTSPAGSYRGSMVVARGVRRRTGAGAKPTAAATAATDTPAPSGPAAAPDDAAPTPAAPAPTPSAPTAPAPARPARAPDASAPASAEAAPPPPTPRPPSTPSVEPTAPPPDPADLDELTLVVRAQEGDTAAFEALARRHQVALHRLAVRVMGDPVEAEDALQEALLDAWRRIGHFRGDAAFSTWMYRVVTNRCLSQLRRRHPEPVAEMDDRVPARDDPVRTAEVDAGLAALGRALDALPAEQRVCWVVRELEGMGYADISEITGATEHAVRGRIHRARATLAEVMRPWR